MERENNQQPAEANLNQQQVGVNSQSQVNAQQPQQHIGVNPQSQVYAQHQPQVGIGAQPRANYQPQEGVNPQPQASINAQPQVGVVSQTNQSGNVPNQTNETTNVGQAQAAYNQSQNIARGPIAPQITPIINGNPIKPTSKQKNDNSKFIIIGVVAAVIIFGLLAVIASLAKNNNSSSQEIINKNTYQVNYRGYSLNIPNDLIYAEVDGTLMLTDETESWGGEILIEKGSYAQLKANKSQLKPAMESGGNSSSVAKIKTINGVEFVTLELSTNGTNAVIGFAKLNSMNFVGVSGFKKANDFDYDIFKILASIIKTAKKLDGTTNMKVDTKLNMDIISELVK